MHKVVRCIGLSGVHRVAIGLSGVNTYRVVRVIRLSGVNRVVRCVVRPKE